MKHLTIHIPDNKFQYVVELLSGLNFIKIDASATEDFSISEEQKSLVEAEYKKFDENPSSGISWDEVTRRLKNIN